MAKQSNDFQRLLFHLQEMLAPRGASVTESALVKVKGLGKLREIDILVETPSGPRSSKVAYEAKDHKRKLNVTQMESIVGKYRAEGSIHVDKVCVVTRNGFSLTAKEKAELNHIEIYTLSEITKSDGAMCLPTGLFSIAEPPVVSHLAIWTEDQSAKIADEDVYEGHLFCVCHDKDWGPIRDFLNHRLLSLPEAELLQLAKDGGEKLFAVNGRMYLGHADKKITIKGFRVEVKPSIKSGKLKSRRFIFQGASADRHEFTRLNAQAGGHRLNMLVDESICLSDLDINIDIKKNPQFPQ